MRALLIVCALFNLTTSVQHGMSLIFMHLSTIVIMYTLEITALYQVERKSNTKLFNRLAFGFKGRIVGDFHKQETIDTIMQ